MQMSASVRLEGAYDVNSAQPNPVRRDALQRTRNSIKPGKFQ